MGTKCCFVQMVTVIGNGARLKYCDDCNYWKMNMDMLTEDTEDRSQFQIIVRWPQRKGLLSSAHLCHSLLNPLALEPEKQGQRSWQKRTEKISHTPISTKSGLYVITPQRFIESCQGWNFWAQDLFDVPAMLKWMKFFGEHGTVHK